MNFRDVLYGIAAADAVGNPHKLRREITIYGNCASDT